MIAHHHTQAYVSAVDAERRGDELERLVRRAARGEHQAWDALVRRFSRRLARVARAHRVASADVEDIVQITFVRLHEQIGNLRDPRALPGWLDTTARRESLRHLRLSMRERPLDSGIVENLPAENEPQLVAVNAELRAELEAALGRLNDRQRGLLTMLFADEVISYDEISESLDMPIGSIGPTRGRAFDRLRADEELAKLAAEHLESAFDDASTAAPHARPWAGTSAS